MRSHRRNVGWVTLAAAGAALCSLPSAGQAQSSSAADAIPRMADGRPDFTGTWDNGSGIDFLRPQRDGDSICIGGCPRPQPAQAASGNRPAPPPPDRPRYRAELEAKVRELEARQVDEDPVLRCFAPGVPRIGPPDKIVQRPGEVVFLYDDVSGNFFRIIPTDGRPHRTDTEPSYLGDAVGHWDGDTLVIETVNFNDQTWLTDDGAFHTTDLRVVEQLTRTSDTLEWRATAHDAQVLAEPWKLRPRTAHLTDQELVEAPPCIERDLDHMVDDSHHDNPR
jgi:hypothetical protein